MPEIVIENISSKRVNPTTDVVRSISNPEVVTSLNSSIINSPAVCKPLAITEHFLPLISQIQQRSLQRMTGQAI